MKNWPDDSEHELNRMLLNTGWLRTKTKRHHWTSKKKQCWLVRFENVKNCIKFFRIKDVFVAK